MIANREPNQHIIPREPAIRHAFGPILKDVNQTMIVVGNNIAIKRNPAAALEKAWVNSGVGSNMGRPKPNHLYKSTRFIENTTIKDMKINGNAAEKKNIKIPIEPRICHIFKAFPSITWQSCGNANLHLDSS